MSQPEPARKPPAKMERRDVRVTIRFAESEAETLAEGARHRGEELSRYIRRVALMGNSVTRAMPA